MTVPFKKKLIEVALPLEAINKAAAYEKMPGIGPHPRGIHLWWARRPLAAARAVIFSQLVDDPSANPDLFPTEKKQEKERERLFKIIEDLVLWENTSNEDVLQRARDEIWQSWRRACAENTNHPQAKELFDRNKLPAFHDPFAGGGALPLEAQRLGLESYASDLNPVAVLINKAMIEIPPKFAGKSPVNPESRQKDVGTQTWKGAQGLAEDVRYYGLWMRNEAEKHIGHLYPKIEITAAMAKERPDLKKYVGRKLTVIAWLWARTVKSPNPAFAQVGRGGRFQCLMSGTPIPVAYIREQGLSGTLGSRMMAIVAEGSNGRVYLSPDDAAEKAVASAVPSWVPEQEINHNPRDIRTQLYGLMKYGDLFTPRQLVALTTFSDLVQEARERVKRDALAAGQPDLPAETSAKVDNNKTLRDGGTGATAYADAMGGYLAFAVDRCCDFSNSCTRWVAGNQKVMNLFGKQAIAMTWDFPEAALLHETVGGFEPTADFIAECILKLPQYGVGISSQQDAMTNQISCGKIVSSDPPYYDNIGYADLSDFFYVWLRRSLKSVFPDLFTTLAVPKAEELVATPYRHGSKEKAEKFFLNGMTQAMHRLAEQAHPAFPVTIYYAFKQSESDGDDGTTNTGCDTFLAAVIEAGFAITGTWPMRSEQEYRMVGMGTNALASSIVLVCRPRATHALTATRREFVTALKAELPQALAHLQRGKKRATEALAYNGLVQSWPEILRLSREGVKAKGMVEQELNL